MRGWGIALTLVATQAVAASPGDTTTWRTGAAFERQLQSLVPAAQWHGDPLREALASLARSHRVAVFLDRRVDPSRHLRLTVRRASLEQTLEQIANSVGLGVAVLDDVVYLGPPATTNVLPALVQRRGSERALAARFAWPELTTPQTLIESLAREAGLQWPAAERAKVPHDLWPAVDLPRQSWRQRLTVVLGGFGLTYRIANGQLQLTAIPSAANYTRAYRVTGAKARQLRAALAQQHPQARVTLGSGQARITGSAEVHRAASRLIAAAAGGRAPGEAQTLLTFRVKNQSVQAVLQKLAADLNLTLQVTPSAQESLKTLVSLEVRDATLKELIDVIGQKAGVRAELRGTTVVVGGEADSDSTG